MQQPGGDYISSSPYYPHHYPTPNPTDFPPPNPIHPPFPGAAAAGGSASAPPYSNYSAGAGAGDFTAYSSPYPPYSQTSDPVPNLAPSAPSYAQPQTQPQTPPSQFPPYQPYNPSDTYPHLQQPSSINYYPFDQPHQSSSSSATNFAPNPNPSFSSPYPPYEGSYNSPAAKFNHGGTYFNEGSGNYGGYGDGGVRYDRAGNQDDGIGDGVYRYDGGRSEPYGARGTGSSARTWSGFEEGYGRSSFDDYGRSLSFSSSAKEQSGSTGKIVRAVPKAETNDNVKSGVQKFRVKLLAEGGGQATDVLCQIGLDGIRMLDPSSNRTLRIYPLETVTRWEVTDPSTYTFWSKSSVDIEPRRIRLQSSRYTTSTILDTVTAATVQLKEMGGRDNSSTGTADTSKLSDHSTEKKKGLVDWMNIIKPVNEEKDHWVPDEAVSKCTSCGADFGAFVRKHHCRNCGDIFCDKCTQGRIALTADDNAQPVRVCDRCMAEVSQRLSNAKEAINKSAALHSHEDLAKKLQEVMDKKKPSSGSKSSEGSGRRMREVACPICTVHLQVQVPASGSETIECGVCQHPFLVSAH